MVAADGKDRVARGKRQDFLRQDFLRVAFTEKPSDRPHFFDWCDATPIS
jgi:hypothetical protein